MIRWLFLLIVLAALLPGCGDVYLHGEALTAAEMSTMDALQAVRRSSDSDPPTPALIRSYLTENFRQWRYFVRAARRQADWGPKLEGE